MVGVVGERGGGTNEMGAVVVVGMDVVGSGEIGDGSGDGTADMCASAIAIDGGVIGRGDGTAVVCVDDDVSSGKIGGFFVVVGKYFNQIASLSIRLISRRARALRALSLSPESELGIGYGISYLRH